MRRLALILLVVSAACEGRQTPTDPTITSRPRAREPLVVSGRVVDFVTGVGVPNATVAFEEDTLGGTTATAVADAGGAYALPLQDIGSYRQLVDGRFAGAGRVTGPGYRGDLLVHDGACVSRYGILADARTGRPVAGATLTLSGVNDTSGADGWYRLDLGCPADRLPEECPPGGTTGISISHPDYGSRFQVTGRGGPCGVARLDIHLER
jgi:hypothetical protein